MKTELVFIALALTAGAALAKGGGHSSGHSRSAGGHANGSPHSVRGYVKKDGTYVAPHRATSPDKTKANNWSTKGNQNPDTGKNGTVDPNKP
ncbi:hypothetical protein [Caenimonas koreensis]|uniref:hypothetical protein n=1 Tax=Caenimonas koreensis TaxID=367474 RepID=UPI0037849969